MPVPCAAGLVLAASRSVRANGRRRGRRFGDVPGRGERRPGTRVGDLRDRRTQARPEGDERDRPGRQTEGSERSRAPGRVRRPLGGEVHDGRRPEAGRSSPCYRGGPIMTASAPTYDLMLLLDPKADDAVRQKVREDVRTMISASGTITSAHDYGRRPLAFEIDHEGEADYELLQFEGPRTLLEQLQRTLRIADGVVRFRIIKLREGTPAAPDLRQSAQAAAEPVGDDAVAEPAAG